ncbi:glycosyltransferase [Bosea sp. SSUT16]|uniref:Glycosyltransferase n=1 Tax=Bosea spartocytisi TaxID=2773451 RepID=A0A927EA30_9HYPH|nr:glycosyltransferase [Bosea spartocytisi]MBD3847118.1 glycosyltransferase [Bosea spartocytisi]MCT4474186.1 glycosyltransferase [Bosea spartocytisi]
MAEPETCEEDMTRRIFYWVGLTVTQPFNTGVQRVVRCLAASLVKSGVDLIPVKWDPEAGRIALISRAEADHLSNWDGPQITMPASLPASLKGEWLLLPEITLPVVPAGSNVAKLGASLGMHVAAIFYDLIPLYERERYPAATLVALAEYWETFAGIDLALPISETVAPDIRRWLYDRNRAYPKLTVPCLLSGESLSTERETHAASFPSDDTPFRIVAVGSCEPRKNYPRILRALKSARQSTGRDIRLTIIGRRMPVEYPGLHAEMEGLASDLGAGVASFVAGADDQQMGAYFANAHATIFGSWIEGFGLPVLESLWRGRPCLCHNGSALAEIAPGGGALMLDMLDEDEIAHGIESLVTDAALFDRLSAEAVSRPLSSWDDYGDDVLAALERFELVDRMMGHDSIGYSRAS